MSERDEERQVVREWVDPTNGLTYRVVLPADRTLTVQVKELAEGLETPWLSPSNHGLPALHRLITRLEGELEEARGELEISKQLQDNQAATIRTKHALIRQQEKELEKARKDAEYRSLIDFLMEELADVLPRLPDNTPDEEVLRVAKERIQELEGEAEEDVAMVGRLAHTAIRLRRERDSFRSALRRAVGWMKDEGGVDPARLCAGGRPGRGGGVMRVTLRERAIELLIRFTPGYAERLARATNYELNRFERWLVEPVAEKLSRAKQTAFRLSCLEVLGEDPEDW